MTVNEKKAKVQAEANAAIDANDGYGLIAMATGVGKSKVGMDRTIKILGSQLGKLKVLLVVPTEKLRDEGWRNEFEKWDYEYLYNYIERTCYASLHNYESEDFDLVILDECHNITPNNSIFFHNNTVKSCIGLTATPPRNEKAIILAQILKCRTHIDAIGNRVIIPTYQITLDQAVEMELVAPYDITIVTMQLDAVDKYISSGKPPKTFMQTELAKYEYLTRLVNFGRNKFNTINRMRFIYTLRSKTQIAQKILENVIPKDRRTIIFCGSKDQANKVCPYTFYSKPSKPKKKIKTEIPYAEHDLAEMQYQEDLKQWKCNNELNFTQFVEEKINRLACVEALNEGVNIPSVDIAFMIQINSNDKDLWQRIGRIIRAREGHIGKVIILTVENTVDIEWTHKAIKGLDNTKINWVKLEDLRIGKEKINFN